MSKPTQKKHTVKKNLKERPAWDDGLNNDTYSDARMEARKADPFRNPWDISPEEAEEIRRGWDEAANAPPPKKQRAKRNANGEITPTSEMVWKCPNCEYEWYAPELTDCPRCHVHLTTSRPSMGLFYPMIAAMQMIEDGADPRDGQIDDVLDSLMKEQLQEAKDYQKTSEPRKAAPHRRAIFYPADQEPQKKDPNIIYVPTHNLSQEELKQHPNCPLCHLMIRLNQRTAILPCNHVFHASCLTTYLRKESECPKCHTSLISS